MASVRGSRRLIWGAVALGAAVVAAVVLVWFQPQKLLIDERTSDTVPPTEKAEPDTVDLSGDQPSEPIGERDGPVELASGEFVSLDHDTTGRAQVLDLGGGQRIVRLEGLDTDNGPDLFLYLSSNPTSGDEGRFDDDFVNLGRLKGNQGDQNYDLPPEVDLATHPTVVIWCDRFNSAFGAADLTLV